MTGPRLAAALGQLLVIELGEGTRDRAAERLLDRCHPGGIVVPALERAESTARLLAGIARRLDGVPFLAIEGESLASHRAFRLPSPLTAALNGTAAAERLGELTGATMKLLGSNTYFGPVLDLKTSPPEAANDDRAFGRDPDEVAGCGKAFLKGLDRYRVLACGKHFPGLPQTGAPLGRVPVVSKSMAELWREDLVPYRKLLARLPLVELGHAAYKAYDFDPPRPAVLSASVIEGLLRMKLGYKGVVVARIAETEVAGRGLDPGEAAAESLKAGCDLLLLSSEEAETVEARLRAAFETRRLSARRLEDALNRTRAARRGLLPPPGQVPKGALERLARQCEDFAKECRRPEQKIA